jgi:hypothetical protein
VFQNKLLSNAVQNKRSEINVYMTKKLNFHTSNVTYVIIPIKICEGNTSCLAHGEIHRVWHMEKYIVFGEIQSS